jgi:hypothetical protein
VTAGLIANFSFDSFSGSGTTDSAGGRTASCGVTSSCPSAGTGKVGADLVFDPNVDYLQTGSDASLNPSSGLSISVWIKPTDWNGNNRIVQKGLSDNQYRLTAEFGVLKFDIAGVGNVTTALPNTGTWSHVVATYDGQNLKIYQNGQLLVNGPATGALPSTNDPLFIGTKTDTSVATDHFHGELDELRIYNRALTTAEVQTLAGVPVAFNWFSSSQLANAWQALQNLGQAFRDFLHNLFTQFLSYV